MNRRAAVLAFALALAGCAGAGLVPLPRADFVPTEPRLATDAFVAEDGARLPLRVWLPQGEVKATVLAVHGFNDYSNAFAGPAEAWAEAGIATYAYDQRGFGQAPDRGLWVGTERLDQDLALASRLVARRHPHVPHYLLGESMGGAVVMTAAAGVTGAERPLADGLILSAPAVWGRDAMNVFERVALWLAYRVAPEMTFTGAGLHIRPSDNIAMLRALSRDPLVIKATRVDAIKGVVDLMDLALDSAPNLHEPLLVLYGKHDELIPPEAMRMMVAALPRSDRNEQRVALYPDGYHMLLRDLEAPLVQHDVASWVLHPTAPLPSGTDATAGRFAAASG